MSYQSFFKDKRVTVLGLGLLGRGVGVVAFIAEQGAQVLVTDKKTEGELAESVAKLRALPNVTFVLGEHRIEDFTDTDMVIKAAGVPLNSPEITAAKEAGVPVYMSTALAAQFAKENGATIVGVTGTRGKSTVSHLIRHILKGAGKSVHLGGNVRGVSTLAMLPEIKSGDVLVLELDSWQLQGFGDLKISPQISVFTNLQPDHQNYYPDMELYFQDKANIFRNQKEGDVLVCGKEIAAKIIAAHPPVTPQVPDALSEVALKIVGEHNRENASLAAAAVRALGVSEEVIREGLESFEPVEGRLQMVREVNLPRVAGGKAGGVKIYNDNNATTPDATIAAIKAVSDGSKNIILIMGGADKGLDMSTLLYEVAKVCKRVILLPGTGTDRVVPLMQDYSVYDDMKTAVHEAVTIATPGDTILFSPAFASFGLFKNEYDRNDQFLAAVNSL